MKKFAIAFGILAALAVAFAYWLFLPSRANIRDVRQAETLVLVAGSDYPTSLTIRGKGQIDNEATISLMEGERVYKTQKLSGVVDFEWGGDWYTGTAEIRYEPTNVHSGNIVLTYRFR